MVFLVSQPLTIFLKSKVEKAVPNCQWFNQLSKEHHVVPVAKSLKFILEIFLFYSSYPHKKIMIV